MKLSLLLSVAVAACNSPSGGTGSTGSAGSQGSQGYAGSNGQNGAAGPTGPQGPPGVAGKDGSNGVANGTRISAGMLTTADGFIETPYGPYHDAQRSEACYFLTAADGVLRCLPDVGAASAVATWWADSGCATSPIAAYQSCASGAPTYAVETNTVTTTCPATIVYHVYNLGSEVPPATQLYQGTPASCSTLTLSGYDIYNLGSEVPANSFAAASVQ